MEPVLSDLNQSEVTQETRQEDDRRLLLPVSEVVGLLGVSRMTAIRRIQSGAWPSARCGRNYLVPREFVDGVAAEIKAGRPIVIEEYAAAWLAKAAENAA